MSMTLYYGEPNGPSLTVLAAMKEKGLNADCIPLDLTSGERHRIEALRSLAVDMSVEGEGPVLVVDGEPMADSVFIGCYLDEIAGDATLVPGDAHNRWKVMTWCRYVIERIAPAAAYLGTQAYLSPSLSQMRDNEFQELIAPIVSVDLKERWQAAFDNEYEESKLEDSKAKLRQVVEKIEATLPEHGGEWLLGEFSLADLETFSWLNGMQSLVPEAFNEAPATAAWLQRIAGRPSVVSALQMARTDHPQNVWAPGPEINRWG